MGSALSRVTFVCFMFFFHFFHFCRPLWISKAAMPSACPLPANLSRLTQGLVAMQHIRRLGVKEWVS